TPVLLIIHPTTPFFNSFSARTCLKSLRMGCERQCIAYLATRCQRHSQSGYADVWSSWFSFELQYLADFAGTLAPPCIPDQFNRSVELSVMVVGIDCLPGWQIFGKRAPAAVSMRLIEEDGVEHRAHIVGARPATWLGRRDQRLYPMPVRISE